MALKKNGKSPVTSADSRPVMLFKDISLGPHEAELRFRTVHFWEARNPVNKLLIGLEMLLIDEQGTAIQGFIPSGRVDKFLPRMKAGALYSLNNFFGSKSKDVFRVADHSVTVSFSWNFVMSPLENNPLLFEPDRYRFHSAAEFESNCDGKGDLYGKVVNGQSLIDRPILDNVEVATTRRILIHVQSHDGPLVKLYLWDKAATDFFKKFNASENTPTVLLVRTVYPKRLGGTLSLTSMSSSRIFMDYDIQPTVDYFNWLGANPNVAQMVNAEVVTKTEVLTIGEIYSYIKQEGAKEAVFECTATIDDVVHSSAWYYISCGGCHTKDTKGPNSLLCSKCGKDNITGVPQISVYDNSEQAVFVLLGDAGLQLTGKQASELVASYYEANDDQGVDHVVPVPQALIDTIGQTHRFIVKVSERNFNGSTRALTVTKILPKEAPPSLPSSVDNRIAPASGGTLMSENYVGGSSKSRGDSANGVVKRSLDSLEAEKVKRFKPGK